ncbi:lipolytic protein G-D-S-L family [Crinalium epipsammum PCC 9333]|uniref:Lipolytic protein G-D-S-L family n=1 Tax=Crinalium epipsammum PCC 9333 TaxID=1173022 RepID=K9VWQ7_9CYAN|nr:SGNH/GDSL hydrolase family protein [Crinalium epipsammum]AFZ12426.1 lipolytic protein G-D-S-L family [Crinalium epipsammum PCC 9333]
MSKISAVTKYVITVLFTGLGVLNLSRIQIYGVGDEVMAASSVSNSKNNPIIPAFNTNSNLKINRPVQFKPTAILTDNLTSEPWWQKRVKSQVSSSQNKQYKVCLFGDSISSALGDTLGEENFNFAIGGMSTVSLLAQMKLLNSVSVKCQTGIMAIGTNDADYQITNEAFVKNLKDTILLAKSMGANQVYVIPAFYSTVEASRNPKMAGSIERVEEINALIRQVAAREKATLFEADIQPLYQGQALRKNFTTDGVHLNPEGIKIYRKALLNIINLPKQDCGVSPESVTSKQSPVNSQPSPVNSNQSPVNSQPSPVNSNQF